MKSKEHKEDQVQLQRKINKEDHVKKKKKRKKKIKGITICKESGGP
jgi:hypothetical protein